MADKTQNMVENLAVQDDDLAAIKVRCKRRPQYIRAGVAFPFGTSTHVVTWAQYDILQADRSGALAVSLVEAPAPGAGDEETSPVSLGGMGDGVNVVTDDEPTLGDNDAPDGPTPDQEVVLAREKLERIVNAVLNAPGDVPVTGSGKVDLAWLKEQLGEPVTAAERDAALDELAKRQTADNKS
ncbi:hypothetical protein [Aeromonas enteropelogenes]|uniref:hypothetical protein n=1 Tax=Aeromonas enteropelogenes TaxID=29489 RepID=UPI003BA1F1B5